MNTYQLFRILSSDSYTKKYFTNIYARNELPMNVRFPSCFIINTHNRDEPGEHWLAFFLDEFGNVEFFDPLGFSLDFYKLDGYVNKISKNRVKISTKQVQGFFSNFCGIYCVYFLHQKCRGKTFQEVLNSLGRMNENNRYISENLKKFL